MTNDGVSTNDFAQILSDFGRTLSYKVVTKTTDGMTGDETSTYASASNITAVFFKNDTRYLFDKEGLLQVGDAYIIAATTSGIKRYDQFTIDSITYYVESVVRRVVLGTTMMDYGTCFVVTN
jgi:hypothetical protein